MKFSELKPTLGSAADINTPERPTWRVYFECPKCRSGTCVAISAKEPHHPIWKIQPDPLAFMANVTASEPIEKQWERYWDSVSLFPSMQQLPHPRKVSCTAHFSVLDGVVVNH